MAVRRPPLPRGQRDDKFLWIRISLDTFRALSRYAKANNLPVGVAAGNLVTEALRSKPSSGRAVVSAKPPDNVQVVAATLMRAKPWLEIDTPPSASLAHARGRLGGGRGTAGTIPLAKFIGDEAVAARVRSHDAAPDRQ